MHGVRSAGWPRSRNGPTARPRCIWRWTREQLQLIPSNVVVDIASSTVFGAKFVEFDAAGGPRPPQKMYAGQVFEPARDRRDQHCLRATRHRCWTRSTRRSSTRPSARSRRRSTAAARSSARRWSTSTRCWPRSTRACPTCSHDIRRAVPTLDRLRRRGAGPALDRPEHDDTEQLPRRPAAEPGRSSWSAQSVWPTSATRWSAITGRR